VKIPADEDNKEYLSNWLRIRTGGDEEVSNLQEKQQKKWRNL
jgi:hypothetical protein